MHDNQYKHGTKNTIVRKVREQSELRKNYCVLRRIAYILLNDCQLKISMQKSYELEIFKKRYNGYYFS